jgi:hypothetical protein
VRREITRKRYRKKVSYMSAYNDRRTVAKRRQGDRRWLGNLAEITGEKHLKEDCGEKRDLDRRTGDDRRDKHSPYNGISF